MNNLMIWSLIIGITMIGAGLFCTAQSMKLETKPNPEMKIEKMITCNSTHCIIKKQLIMEDHNENTN